MTRVTAAANPSDTMTFRIDIDLAARAAE